MPIGGHWGELGFFAYPDIQNHATRTQNIGSSPEKYKIIELDVGDRNPDKVWDLLTTVHSQFVVNSPNFSYGFGQNSNSYAATLLWMVGVDVSSRLGDVKPNEVSKFPGVEQNILTNGFF